MHKQHRTATVKVGLLTIIALVVLTSTVIWLRGRSLGGGVRYEVIFNDVDGLRKGAPVQFMGIRVGYIEDIKVIEHAVAPGNKTAGASGAPLPNTVVPSDFEVKVVFGINRADVIPPKGSVVSVEQSGIIGEKFLEIMPPRPEHTYLMVNSEHHSITMGTPILVRFHDGLSQVGEVQHVIKSKSVHGYIYELTYIIDRPGYRPREKHVFKVYPYQEDRTALILVDPSAVIVEAPDANEQFSVEEPLRIKKFFASQLETADSMKKTNEKINSLLSPDVIASIQSTLKNSEQLTAEANDALEQVNKLLDTTGQDLKSLIASAQTLSTTVTTMTNNVNDIVKDPQLKQDLKDSVAAVKTSTEALSGILEDPDLKVIMSDLRFTADNTAEMSAYLKHMTVDNKLEERVNSSVTSLQESLAMLNAVLNDISDVTADKQKLKDTFENVRATSQNLDEFSTKLNKRFLLFRLLF